MNCAVPDCTKKAKFFQAFRIRHEKEWGMVCATHDNFFGRKNLLAAGLTNDQAIAVERELKRGDKDEQNQS